MSQRIYKINNKTITFHFQNADRLLLHKLLLAFLLLLHSYSYSHFKKVPVCVKKNQAYQ